MREARRQKRLPEAGAASGPGRSRGAKRGVPARCNGQHHPGRRSGFHYDRRRLCADGVRSAAQGAARAGTLLILADGETPMPESVGGLGRCLLHAMQGGFVLGFQAVCLVNADGPTLPTSYLRRAATTLLERPERVILFSGRLRMRLISDRRDRPPSLAVCGHCLEHPRRRRRHARTGASAGAGSGRTLRGTTSTTHPSLARLVADLSESIRPASAHTPYPAPATATCLRRLGLLPRAFALRP